MGPIWKSPFFWRTDISPKDKSENVGKNEIITFWSYKIRSHFDQVKTPESYGSHGSKCIAQSTIVRHLSSSQLPVCLIKKVTAADREGVVAQRRQSYQCGETSGLRVVQHSKLNYDIDTLQIVLCCVKSFLFRIGNTVEEDCLFSTCSQTTSEVLVLCDKISEYI